MKLNFVCMPNGAISRVKINPTEKKKDKKKVFSRYTADIWLMCIIYKELQH